METRIWSKAHEKWAHVLVLRGHEISLLKVTGNVLTLKRNLGRVLENLSSGTAPSEAGASGMMTIDPRAIGKAEVSPGNSSLTL